jgi:hypothetical protein
MDSIRYSAVMANTFPKRFTNKLQLRVDDEFKAAVEELRRLSSPIPTASEVIRCAVMQELARAKSAGAKKKGRK